jgi:hypothetical protein
VLKLSAQVWVDPNNASKIKLPKGVALEVYVAPHLVVSYRSSVCRYLTMYDRYKEPAVVDNSTTPGKRERRPSAAYVFCSLPAVSLRFVLLLLIAPSRLATPTLSHLPIGARHLTAAAPKVTREKVMATMPRRYGNLLLSVPTSVFASHVGGVSSAGSLCSPRVLCPRLMCFLSLHLLS